MEIHKPKPIHNWREFLKEVGTIVLGVSIALAAEQAVEYFHWRAQVAEARDVIATELVGNLTSGITRVRTLACTERRLDQLAQIVDGAAKTGSLPPVGDIGMPPRATWPTGTWDSVVASQTATHFPRQLLADMAGAYKFAQRLEEFSGREVEAWNTLYSMTGPGRRLDPASESELRKALSNARSSSRIMAALGLQLAVRVADLHLPFSQDDLARIAAAKRPPTSDPTYICQPIGPATAFYGQAARFNPNSLRARKRVTNIDEAIKALPDFSESAR